MNKIKCPFEIEDLRRKYAQNKDERKFRELYKKKIPSISNNNSKELWDKRLGYNLSIQDPMTKDRVKKTARLINVKHSMKILDIGIGDAWVELEFQKRHKDFSLVGVDIASDSLKKIENKFIKFKSVVSNIENLSKKLDGEKFDCILALEIFEHIDAWKILKIQKSLRNLLKKDGQLIISVPTNEDLVEKIERKENFSAHVRRYTPEVIRFELGIGGYKIAKQVKLFAFSKFYGFKTIIAKISGIRQPNVIILSLLKK